MGKKVIITTLDGRSAPEKQQLSDEVAAFLGIQGSDVLVLPGVSEVTVIEEHCHPVVTSPEKKGHKKDSE